MRRPWLASGMAGGMVGLVVTALAVVASACIAFATSLPLYLFGMAVGGIAQGTYLSVDLALISEVLPDRKNDAARDFAHSSQRAACARPGST